MLGFSIILIEARRRPDLLSLFVFFFFIQVIVPGGVIPVILWAIGEAPILGNTFFDRVYNDVTGEIIALSALMAGLFLLALYSVFFMCHHRTMIRVLPNKGVLDIPVNRYVAVVVLGGISSLILLNSMPGDGYFDKYANLVLFRAQHEAVMEIRNVLTANLFALTQTFALLVILGLSLMKDRSKSRSLLVLIPLVGLIIFFGVMTVSRRMLAIQVVLIYLTNVLVTGKWNLKAILLIALVFFPVMMFGKDFLAQIVSVGSGDEMVSSFDRSSYWLATLNGFSSLGITLNSSWSTFLYLDSMPMRFGMDHIVTVLRFLPMGSFGIDEDALLPARIVRLSTAAFVGAEELDIPPGIIGQMWLDFGVLGPLLWGGAFGWLLGWLQTKRVQYENSWVGSGVFVILLFVVALPLNTGSIDFNLSIDMFLMLLILYVLAKTRKRARNGTREVTKDVEQIAH